MKVQKAQWGEPRGLHTSRTSFKLWNTERCEWWRRAGGREGSKTYVRGGMGRLGRYRLLLSAGREWSCRSDKGLKPTNMPEGFQVTRRCRGFHFSSANMLLLSFFLWILVEIKMTWNDTIYGTIASVTLATVSLIKKRKHTVGVTRKIIVRAAYALASWIIFVPETMDGRQQKYWCFFFLKKWQKTVEAGSRSRDSLPNVSFETGPLNKAALSARQRVVQESMQPSVCLNFFQPVLWPGPRKEWMFKLFWGKIQESGDWCSERYGDSGVRVLRRYVVSVFYSGRCETEQHRDWRKLQH